MSTAINITQGVKKMEFHHAVDKSIVPVCNIMGVDVAAVNMEWVLSFIYENIKKLSGDYICITNVHTVVTAYEDEKYRIIQNNAMLSIPDGGPLSVVGQRRGFKKMNRTTGPNLMQEIFKVSVQYDYKHFFYGSTQDTINRMKFNLLKNYPNLNIVGVHAPPFRELNEEEDKADVDMINAANADFVWIGLGAPKQEIWMSVHQNRVKGLMIGVGAGFDYFAGNIKRAPDWMQNNNLEWVFRLIQDPKRLFHRYWHTNWRFIWHAYIKGE